MPDIDSLRISHNLAKRTIAYCKRYNEVGNGYTFFMQQLGKSFIYLSHLSFWSSQVSVWWTCTPSEITVKGQIISAFSDPHSTLRVVIATIAFGMGLDCPNVAEVIHWGPSFSVEDYIQEIGGQGAIAHAKLYFSKEISSLCQWEWRATVETQRNVGESSYFVTLMNLMLHHKVASVVIFV